MFVASTVFIFLAETDYENTRLEGATVYKVLLPSMLVALCLCFFVKSLFYFFLLFEYTLIPLMLYLGVRGSKKENKKAVNYLVIYTLIGSAFLWAVVLYFFAVLGTTGFDEVQQFLETGVLAAPTRVVLLISVLLGFAFKVPMVPFHPWLIVAHVEAPTVGSVILAALVLKVGGYGIFRFGYSLFPAEILLLSPALVLIALLGYLYSTVAAVRQQDLKRYVAYTSVAHMNFGLIGLFTGETIGAEAFIFTMLSHGLIATGMFLVIGYFYAFTEFRDTVRLRGLASLNPKLAVLWVVLSLANMGMPLFAGFPGEYYTIVAAAQYNAYLPWFLFIGFYLSGAYTFLHLTRFLYGSGMRAKAVELSSRTLGLFANLLFWVILLGLLPSVVFGTLEVGIVDVQPSTLFGLEETAQAVRADLLVSDTTALVGECPSPTSVSSETDTLDVGDCTAPGTVELGANTSISNNEQAVGGGDQACTNHRPKKSEVGGQVAAAELRAAAVQTSNVGGGVGKLNDSSSANPRKALVQVADLDFELDTYEWFCLLRPEVDTTVTINRDLAYRYGQEYLTGLLADRVGEGQHVYHRGLAQEVQMLLPLPNTVAEALEGLELEAQDSTRLRLIGVDSDL